MDARSLLRAHKATARVEHPYATYSVSGQLRCSICAAPVQKWDAHLLTKQHRTSVAREKASQAKAQQAAAKKRSLAAESSAATKKVRIDEPVAEAEAAASSALPAGFFSDPVKQAEATAEPEAETDIPLPNATGDAELDDFFASLAAPPVEAASAATASSNRRQKEREEVTAEEVEAQTMYSSAPVRLATDTDKAAAAAAAAADEADPEETEFDKRARLARYEKEEVMSRLMEEERAQEDADQRVAALKARMEAVKARRKALAEAGGLNAKAKPKAS